MALEKFYGPTGNEATEVVAIDPVTGQAVPPGSPAAQTVLNQTSGAVTVTGNSGPLAVTNYRELAVDANVTALTGTSPSITFFVDRQGADGIWYRVWTGTALTAPGTSSTSIGMGATTNASVGGTIRFGWTVAGTSPSITFSASIIGK